MQSRKKSHDIFFHSNSLRVSQISSRIQSPMRESQYFGKIKDHKNKLHSSSTVPIYFDHSVKMPIISSDPCEITFSKLRVTTPRLFTNQLTTNYSLQHQLKRSQSNISIISHNSRSSNQSSTKIHFNYISPSKSNTKITTQKWLLNIQDVTNPLKKLKNKNESSKIRLSKSPEINSKNQAVNEYFPEFKVKKNKMHKNVLSPRSNKNSLFQVKKEDTQNKKIQILKWKKNNQIFHPTDQSISQISKSSQVSIPLHDLNLSRKQQNNSSKTTDYEEEMVRKLKQDLRLNYSYYKK